MKYIPVSSISMKLSKAARKGEVLYIQGGIGIGKTVAVQHYLKRKKAIWYDGEQGFLEDLPHDLPSGDEIVVFDNISCIRDLRSKDYILQMIRQGGRQIILIGRGDLPDWLAAVSSQIPFRYASKEDFILERRDLEKAFSKEMMEMEEETVERILRVSCQNPLFFVLLNSRVVNGILTDENYERARTSYYYILDDRFYNMLDREERAVLIALCNFEQFSLEMARRVTLNPHIERTFDKLFRHDACLVCKGKDYEIPEPYRSYLLWKQSLVIEPYKKTDIFRMAASYYTEIDDLFTAVNYYRKAGENDLMAETILRICDDTDLVMRNLDKINECLDLLTVEQSLNNPLIMTTRSMVYSLGMNPDRSEVWYGRLAEYANRSELGRVARTESEFYLAYLDLILPHRGSEKWFDRLFRYLDAKKRWNGQKKMLSITLLGHSVLNGLFDFSRMLEETDHIEQLMDVVKQDKHAMSQMTIVIIKLLLQELALERGEVDDLVFSTQINRVILEGERKGWNDLCVAAIVHYAKRQVIQGDTVNTEKIHRELRKIIKNDAILTEAVRGINTWISMLKGERKTAEEWFISAPDSREFFSLIDKSDYVLKARIHIMKGNYQAAYILLTRLKEVFEEYNRDYLWTLVMLLIAILYHRQKSPRWHDYFTEAMKRAENFRYIRVIADEGAAILPLFNDLEPEEKKEFNPSWYERVEEAVREMAFHYPNYLQETKEKEISLTKAEKKVMTSLCQGLNSEEICDQLHITYSGLKYHKRNIYRKMGVHTIQEAISMAKTMGLDK